MKKYFIFYILMLAVVNVFSQTTLFSEKFEGTTHAFTLNTNDLGGASNTNTWVVNNNYNGGNITIICLGVQFPATLSNSHEQPSNIENSPTSNYLHISSQTAISQGVSNANYLSNDGTCFSGESNFAKMNTAISTLGYTNITFNFWWMNASGRGELYYSLDNGANWILKEGNLTGQPNWQQTSLTDDAWNNQSSLLFGFHFVNNIAVGSGEDPSFAIDDITVVDNSNLNEANFLQNIITSIYPNPSNGVFYIDSKEATTIEIYDILGKLLQNQKIISGTNTLNITDLPNGIYFLKIKTNIGYHYIKLAKK